MPTEPTLSERVSSSYSKLSSVANDLNAVSDELGKFVSQIDEGLRKLNLGVVCWVTIFSDEDDSNPHLVTFWREELGYAKVSGKWGVCLRRLDGCYQSPDDETSTIWTFNDASRMLRLASIEKIPELLEALSKEAANTTKKIQAKLADVQAVAEAVNPPRVARTTNAQRIVSKNTVNTVVVPNNDIDIVVTDMRETTPRLNNLELLASMAPHDGVKK